TSGGGCTCPRRTWESAAAWQCETSWPLSTLLMPERHAEVLEEQLAFLVRTGRGHEGDVHAAHLVDLRVVDLLEDELVLEAERVVAAPVEGVGGHAPEVAHAGQGDVEEPVHELVHAVAAQGDGGGDGHALAQAEGGDGLAAPPHGRLLAGDAAELVDGGVEELDVLRRLPHPHVDHDLAQAGHRHP